MGRASTRFLVFFRALVFIGCAGVFFNGCSIVSCTVVCRDNMIEQAREAYLDEDYTLSRRIFSQLALNENDDQLQAVGLYGNVCIDMVLAENAPAFRTAVERFLLLQAQLSSRISTDNGQEAANGETRHNIWSGMPAGMLEKALVQGMALLESERLATQEDLNDLYARQAAYKKERLGMKKKIDSLGLKITGLENNNVAQKAQITDLLHQITVLEKIDKERQEQRENK